MKKCIIPFMFLGALLCAQEESPKEILRRAGLQATPKQAHALITLSVTRDDQVFTTFLIEGYLSISEEESTTDALLVFHNPATVRGTKFLSKATKAGIDQWIYLPALRDIRRIVGSDQDQSFMGTDFTYGDLAARVLEDYVYTLLDEEVIEGEDSWKIAIEPEKEWIYGRIVEWITKNSYFPIRAQYYDRNNRLLKESRSYGLSQIGKYWVPDRIVMQNAQIDQATELRINKIEFDIAIPPVYFTANNLRRN